MLFMVAVLGYCPVNNAHGIHLNVMAVIAQADSTPVHCELCFTCKMYKGYFHGNSYNNMEYKCVYGKVSEKRDLACIIKKHNKNALRLKCYNFRRVNVIVFLFSALHTTPFLYGKIHFGILNMLHASIAMSDTPRGSNPP